MPRAFLALWVLKFAVAALALCSNLVFGQGWVDVPPLRAVDAARLGSTLADIESRMPPGHIYRDADPITWAHETTHGLNSRVRNAQRGDRWNAFYCLNGKAFVCREPKLRKRDVMAYVPPEFRGEVWHYVAGAAEWDDSPLYLLDEWSAYINGATTNVELRRSDRKSDVRYAVTFAAYATALLAAIEDRDPAYPDKQVLAEFVAHQLERTLAIAAAGKQTGASDSRSDQLTDALFSHWGTP